MKKILLFLIAAITLVVVACTNDDDMPVIAESACDQSETLTNAKSVADRVMQQFGFKAGSRSGNGADVNVWYSDSHHTDTTAIIVNYEDGGFVLVNPDVNAESAVYAVSDEGSYIVGRNPIADEYVYGLAGGGVIGGGGNDTLPKTPEPDFPVIMVCPDDVYHLYKTPNWHQYYPYNKYCFTKTGKQAVVGCVALSIGQICSYHKYPTSIEGRAINWDNILSSEHIYEVPSSDKDALAYFLAKIGQYCYMNYGEEVSLSDMNSAIVAWRTLGYENVKLTQSYSELIGALKTGPAQIRCAHLGSTSGHAWVVDGYKCLYTHILPGIGVGGEIIKEEIISNEYFRFNWGLGGDGNAYYRIGENYTVNNSTFSSNMVAVINIHP